MLLKQFKGTGYGTMLLIIVSMLCIWASAFIKLKGHFSLYFDLDPMPLYGLLSSLIGTNPVPGIILVIFLVSFMVYFLVSLNTNFFFINERTFLPGVIYILLTGLFPQYQLLNPAIIGALFLMLAMRSMLETYRIAGTAYNFFDAGILISTGSLFYAGLIWFGLLGIIGLALLRTGILKEILLTILGLITPYFLTFGTYYALGKDLKELLYLVGYNIFGKPSYYVFNKLTIVAIFFIGLLTLISIFHLLMLLSTKKIKARKTFSLLIWMLFISVGAYFLVPSVSVEIIWITGIPVSYLLTHYFVFVKGKVVPEIIFSLLLIFILLIQVWYIK